MKKLILILVALAIAMPSVCFSIQKFERTGEIERDETGGYDENQTDYKAKRKKQLKKKSSPGYYNGTYHNKGKNYKQGEWQFIESSNSSKK